VLGVEFDTIRDVALALVVAAIVLAVVLAIVVEAIVSKLVVIAVLLGLAAVVWQQRESVQDCADRVGATLAAGAQDDATCTFFGRDITVTSPLGEVLTLLARPAR
jgi:hypothetical protein